MERYLSNEKVPFFLFVYVQILLLMNIRHLDVYVPRAGIQGCSATCPTAANTRKTESRSAGKPLILPEKTVKP